MARNPPGQGASGRLSLAFIVLVCNAGGRGARGRVRQSTRARHLPVPPFASLASRHGTLRAERCREDGAGRGAGRAARNEHESDAMAGADGMAQSGGRAPFQGVTGLQRVDVRDGDGPRAAGGVEPPVRRLVVHEDNVRLAGGAGAGAGAYVAGAGWRRPERGVEARGGGDGGGVAAGSRPARRRRRGASWLSWLAV